MQQRKSRSHRISSNFKTPHSISPAHDSRTFPNSRIQHDAVHDDRSILRWASSDDRSRQDHIPEPVTDPSNVVYRPRTSSGQRESVDDPLTPFGSTHHQNHPNQHAERGATRGGVVFDVHTPAATSLLDASAVDRRYPDNVRRTSNAESALHEQKVESHLNTEMNSLRAKALIESKLLKPEICVTVNLPMVEGNFTLEVDPRTTLKNLREVITGMWPTLRTEPVFFSRGDDVPISEQYEGFSLEQLNLKTDVLKLRYYR